MNGRLLPFYEAIEQASVDMLAAARDGNWDEVMKLEGACVLLISRLKHAAVRQPIDREEMQAKSRIMLRILHNDAELRRLAEPWLEQIEAMLGGAPALLH